MSFDPKLAFESPIQYVYYPIDVRVHRQRPRLVRQRDCPTDIVVSPMLLATMPVVGPPIDRRRLGRIDRLRRLQRTRLVERRR
ncbi:hypothetical protein [Halapricum salinum]|uniref:hypothetical protein n=1 Tax=Halapricum salinum TaxID=1457250 RepID=UPI000678C6C0|nr:hypothetical protein [Halapricum salinum]